MVYLRALEHEEELKEEGREEGRAEGRAEGHKEGLAEGAEQKLVHLICRKLRKKKTPSEIAEALEEDLTDIQKICDTLSAFAPDYEEDRAIEALWPGQSKNGNK